MAGRAALAAAAMGQVPLTPRRIARTALGIGLCAGCMGTWMEISHGVVCIPVLTLPPLQLTHQVAVGSTVFGVAARQVMSAGLFASEPEALKGGILGALDLIDMNAAAALALSSSVTAMSASVLAARLSGRAMRRANGLFLIIVSLVMQYRESLVKLPDKDDQDLLRAQSSEAAAEETNSSEVLGPSAFRFQEAAPSLQPPTPIHELNRYIFLGAVSGVILGLFGIGPAWMLGPMILWTDPHRGEENSAQSPASSALLSAPGPLTRESAQLAASGDLGTSGCDERTTRTCLVAMVPPSIAAALRHWQMGHMANHGQIAGPLAAGAIIGSALAGSQLADVPCDPLLRIFVSGCLFANGMWNLRP